jgi:GxxExxY protein
MEHEDLTQKIIGCSFTVYNKMGFGYLESVYERCMDIELKKNGLDVECQKQLKVCYENQVVGNFVADILVNDLIIIELKSCQRIQEAHEVQLVNYLAATGKPIGLILNFGPKKVEIRRKIKDLTGLIDKIS